MLLCQYITIPPHTLLNGKPNPTTLTPPPPPHNPHPTLHEQSNTGQYVCLTCPAGFYCNATVSPVVYYSAYSCPEGYYCPNGTSHGDQYPCPRGTYNNRTSLATVYECLACAAGMACDRVALSNPVTPCAAGYFCARSANSTTPVQGYSSSSSSCSPSSSLQPHQIRLHPTPQL